MNAETGMYLYPWAVEDFNRFTEEYAATGCNGMAVALAYHHGNILYPRRGRLQPLEQAAVSFTPSLELYGDIVPAVHTDTAQAGTVRHLRAWCESTNRTFCGWVVLLHNPTLGSRYPDLTIENLWGDRYPHALCPSNPRVHGYTRALLKDVCDQFVPDSLMVEAATAMPALYGTLDIGGIRVTAVVRWLLSLCFCPHCMEAAGKKGMDAAPVREEAKALLDRLMNREPACGGEAAELDMLLGEYPLLRAYGQCREDNVTQYIEVVSTLLRQRGVGFKLIPSAVPFEISMVRMEGMSFAKTRGLADMLLPLVYGAGEKYSTVLHSIRMMDRNTPVGMATSLHPSLHPDKESLLAAVADAKDAGCRCIYFYNFSLASSERLTWLPEAVALLG